MVFNKQRSSVIIIPFIGLLCFSDACAQTEINVDFSEPVYYPLLKNKASLGGRPNQPNVPTGMTTLAELEIGATRNIRRQSGSQKIWKNGDDIEVAIAGNDVTYINESHRYFAKPVLTVFETPDDWLPEGAESDRVPPTDIPEYSEGAAMFVDLYSDYKPLCWEIWNEPNGHFLETDDKANVYSQIYEHVAPKIKSKDPDAVIAGPAVSNINAQFVLSEVFIENVKNKNLPLDYYSLHSYNTFGGGGTEGRLIPQIDAARQNMGDDFPTTPIIYTEYEHYPTGDLELQRNREFAVGAVKWLSDLSFFLQQTDIEFISWSRIQHSGTSNNFGGLTDPDLNRRPIYWAYKLYGDMPSERKAVSITNGPEGLHAFASADDTRAGIMVWNDADAPQSIAINTTKVPFPAGTIDVYRIDEDNSSYLENSSNDELSLISSRAFSTLGSLAFDIPAFGIVFLDIIPDSVATQPTVVPARFIRSWSYTPRRADGSICENYGDFNWKNWTARVGVKTSGAGISGVSMDQAPDTIGLQFKSVNTLPDNDINALAGIRLDYMIDDRTYKSVLLHGTFFDDARTSILPWGHQVSSGDEILDMGGLIGNNQIFDFPVVKHAPDGWASGARRLIVSFWLENTGEESQGIGRILKSGQESLNPALVLSLKEIGTQESKFQIYPNPVTDVLIFEGKGPTSTLNIYDATGSMIMTKNLNDDQLDVSALKPGVYFLAAYGQTIRFIKKD